MYSSALKVLRISQVSRAHELYFTIIAKYKSGSVGCEFDLHCVCMGLYIIIIKQGKLV